MEKSCTLCSHDVGLRPTLDGEHIFCCHGCHTVFQILFAKNQHFDFKNSPIFQQAVKSGLISNPDLLEEIKHAQTEVLEGGREKIHLEIGDMWCPSCAEVIKLVLMRYRGITRCLVDYCTDLAVIEFCPEYIGKDQIFTIIQKVGYTPLEFLSQEKKAFSKTLLLRFVVAAFFSLNIMMFSYPIYATYFDYDPEGYGYLLAWLSFFFAIPVLTYGAWPIFKRFFSSLCVGVMGMETLVVMGVTSALFLSLYELAKGGNHVYFDSMTVIIVLVILGKMIESKAKFSAKESIIQLTRSLPRRGRILNANGRELFVSIKEIKIGSHLVVIGGEKIVLDGKVVQGTGLSDESFMTGESIPIKKEPGDTVLAGTVLQQGRLVVEVMKTLEETALNKIVDMVEKEIGHKTAYVRTADLIVKWFVPMVILIAIIIGLSCWFFNFTTGEKAFLRAMSILLISCPCAIGIAAPLAESHLMNALASKGAIIRNRGCLNVLGREHCFVFDKTGTITEGKFQLLEQRGQLNEYDRAILKGLAACSIHPISQAIVNSIKGDVILIDHVEELIGKGLKGVINEFTYWLGSEALMRENCHLTKLPDERDQNIAPVTKVYFGCNNCCLSTLYFGDRVRDGVKEMIHLLKPSVSVLLSGDAKDPVKHIAEVCGFDEFYWSCSPLEKRNYIDTQRQKGNTVVMLGDGTNDAPALTGANVGISVLNATDVSIQVSDILLITDKLSVIPEIRSLARLGQKVVKQNIFWAFFYNCLGIGLAAVGYLTPLYAAGAMVVSSLIVVANAKRIEKYACK